MARSIKPLVISRKNFLFANTPSGAQSSAILFRLIDAARENRLDQYKYLTWVLAGVHQKLAAELMLWMFC